MLPTDPFNDAPNMGEADPNAYETRGWGQSAPFPYPVDQGAGVAMPQPGAPPPGTFAPPPPAPGGGMPPAQSLMEAAQMRQAGMNAPAMVMQLPMPPPGSPADMFGQVQDLQRRQRPGMPRPNPLRAAALIELGKLMAENGRTMKQHHALLEAFHALQGPSGPGQGGEGEQ